MLEMGFKEDVDCILNCVKKTTKKRPQYLLLSATIPDWVRNISDSFLKKDWKLTDLVENLKDKTQKSIDHIAIASPVAKKVQTLNDILLTHGQDKRVLIFTNTKAEADQILYSNDMP